MASGAAQPTVGLTFGDLLRRYRLEAGLTQEALAERSRLSVRGISDLERGRKHYPRRDTLQLLLEALALQPRDEAALIAAARRPLPRVASGIERPTTSSVPLPSTPLLGRESEVGAVVALLRDPTVRFVTLTGLGGVGKTRLAAAVTADLAELFIDGSHWVDLAAVRDPALVLPAVAQALEVVEAPGRSFADGLVVALASRTVLLVIDNCEQVAEAAPAFGDILAACPNVKMLATSRARLRLRGEQVLPVPPLRLPPSEFPFTAENLDALAAVPAVALFVARARQVRPRFALTAGNAAAVAGICHRLDGLPLAIELAAARSALLPPQTLLQRLEHRLPLLTVDWRDAPDRQRTLRDAIAWSYDLLAAAAQSLFRRLTVFVGGFALDALAAVDRGVAESGSPPDWSALLATSPSPRLLDALQALVDASLVVEDDQLDGEPRYHMLETVREFASEQLAASGEEAAVRAAHASYFAAVASERVRCPDILAEEPLFLALFEAETGNLRAALEWVARCGPVETGLRLAQGLGLLAIFRGYLGEPYAWLNRFLTADAEISQDLRARALVVRGMVSLTLGLKEPAEDDAKQAIALADGEGSDPIVRASALYLRGSADRQPMDLESALALCRDRPDGATMASLILTRLSLLTRWDANDAERAIAHLEEALTLLGSRPVIGRAMMVGNLSALIQEQGDERRAAKLRREGLRLDREGRSLAWLIVDLWGAGSAAHAAGCPARAARLLGASMGLRERIGAVVEWFNAPDLDRFTGTLRRELGEVQFAAALAEGRALPLDDAIAEALTVLDEVADDPTGPSER